MAVVKLHGKLSVEQYNFPFIQKQPNICYYTIHEIPIQLPIIYIKPWCADLVT